MVFSKIDEASASSVTSALDFFNVPPTNVSVSSAAYREYLTLNPLNSTPFHFKIHASTNYIDLSKCYLLTEMRIQRADAAGPGGWADLDAAHPTDPTTAPIQLIGSTFIKNIKVSINGRETFDANSLYAYKSYLNSELSYPRSVKDSYLQVSGYYADGNNAMGARVPQNGVTNTGLLARHNLFTGAGHRAQFISQIHADIFQQELYLVNNIEIELEITPHTDTFTILSPQWTPAINARYRLEITDCRLFVKTVSLMDGLALDIAKKLEVQPARYALRKTMAVSHLLTAGRTEAHINLFSDQLPRRLVVGMVANEAFRGDYTLSPFNFQPFDVREITIEANGMQYPACPYNLNFGERIYARPFHDAAEALGMANSTESNGIDFSRFGDGWCIFIFPMTNSLEDESHFDLIKNGTTSIHLKFNTPIPGNGVMLIAIGETDALLMLDKYRTLTSDVTV
jgi:hypothetical protein